MNNHELQADDLAISPSTEMAFTRELPKIGAHQAVCAQIHNVGYQLYQGQVQASPQCVMIFEIGQKMVGGAMDGKQMVISENFGMYLSGESKLRKFLNSWRGKAFTDEDLKSFTLRNLLGKHCTLIITHEPKKNGGMCAKIKGIAPAEKGGEPVLVTYTEVPKWVQEKKAAAVQPPLRKPTNVGSAVSSQAQAETTEEAPPF